MNLHCGLHDLGRYHVVGDILRDDRHQQCPKRQERIDEERQNRRCGSRYPWADHGDKMHDARQNAHKRSVRVADKHKAHESEKTAHDRSDDHAAHIAADRTRKDSHHKTIAGLLLFAHDGTYFSMNARIVACQPISKHQAQKDNEELRSKGADKGEHALAKVTRNLLAIRLDDVCKRGKQRIDVERPRPLRKRAEALQRSGDERTEVAKLLGKVRQDFQALLEKHGNDDHDDTCDNSNHHDQSD